MAKKDNEKYRNFFSHRRTESKKPEMQLHFRLTVFGNFTGHSGRLLAVSLLLDKERSDGQYFTHRQRLVVRFGQRVVVDGYQRAGIDA